MFAVSELCDLELVDFFYVPKSKGQKNFPVKDQ